MASIEYSSLQSRGLPGARRARLCFPAPAATIALSLLLGAPAAQFAAPPLSLTPQQFGARGDGLTDDAPAFRAAFAALAGNGGGTLTVPDTGKPYLMGSWDPTPRDRQLFVGVLPSNITLNGNGTIKIKDSIYPFSTDGANGVFYGVSLFGAFSESNITVSGLTFDMNGANNPQPAGLPHIMNTFRFYTGNHITVSAVTIRNSPGHNMIVFQGNGGDGAIVRNSRFSLGGHGVPGNSLNSDFSFLYSEWSHSQFLGNTIYQSPANDHASGGIELHGSHSLAQGNWIENCNPAIWIASTPADVDDVLVTRNNLINANRGVAFWAGSHLLTNVQVISNNITVHYNPVFTTLYGQGDDAAGILVPWLGAATSGQYVSSTANGSLIRNLTIKANTIFSSDGTLSLNTMPGISIHGVENALVAENSIHDIGSTAIELRGSPWPNRNVLILRNRLRNYGLNSSPTGHEGISIDTTGSSTVPLMPVFDSANVVLTGNSIVGASPATGVAVALNWVQGHMQNLIAGANPTQNATLAIAGPGPEVGGVIFQTPAETVAPAPAPSCATGDITWRVARDTLDGWICAGGQWEVFGK